MDTYTVTVTFTDTTGFIGRGDVTVRVHRVLGTNCDVAELYYRNRIAKHPERDFNIYDLNVRDSTIPSWLCPVSCFCMQPVEPVA